MKDNENFKGFGKKTQQQKRGAPNFAELEGGELKFTLEIPKVELER